MTDRPNPGSEFGDGEPVIRDKRRIDPETGKLREPAEQSAAPAPAGPDGQPPRDNPPSDLIGPSAQSAAPALQTFRQIRAVSGLGPRVLLLTPDGLPYPEPEAAGSPPSRIRVD